MNDSLIHVLAGHTSLTVKQHYLKINHLQNLAVYVKTSRGELAVQLQGLKDKLKADPIDKHPHADAKSIYLKNRHTVDMLRGKMDNVRQQLGAVHNRFIYAIISYISPYKNPPRPQLQVRYASLTRKLHDAETQMDRSRQIYLESKEALKARQGPIDSLTFAIRELDREYAKVLDDLVEHHKHIETLIQAHVQHTPLRFFYSQAGTLERYPDLLVHILKLKRALHWKGHLSAYASPKTQVEEKGDLPDIGRDLKKTLNASFQPNDATIRSQIMFNGSGTAHKKKRSGAGTSSRTYWKKIDVSLKGHVPITHTWRYPLWNSKPFAKQLATTTHRIFRSGFNQVIEQDRLDYVDTVTQDIAQLTAVVRDTLESPSTTSNSTGSTN